MWEDRGQRAVDSALYTPIRGKKVVEKVLLNGFGKGIQVIVKG